MSEFARPAAPPPTVSSYLARSVRTCVLTRRYWAAEHPVREAARQAVIDAAAAEIGELTDREILIAGAIAYWCEGAKGKPRRKSDRVVFINSDPGLIRFFLCFLGTAGVEADRVSYRLYIHESADVSAAEQYWMTITGAESAQFKRPVLKRHNPKTVRKKVGDDYHGCLTVMVARSAELYQQIAGWAAGAMRSSGAL